MKEFKVNEGPFYRGHEVEYKGKTGEWVYSDTQEKVWGNERACGVCNVCRTKEGHDPCIGTLDEREVMNACCGHGEPHKAYIQFHGNKPTIRGSQALLKMILLIRLRELHSD